MKRLLNRKSITLSIVLALILQFGLGPLTAEAYRDRSGELENAFKEDTGMAIIGVMVAIFIVIILVNKSKSDKKETKALEIMADSSGIISDSLKIKFEEIEIKPDSTKID
ncbi:MAG: hypothetical protein NTW14_01360 [bacterium]|nr:hypothetical protein [bacterium]